MEDTDLTVPESEEVSDLPQTQPKPAFTIVVHSWATPIVGVIMLAIGLLGGYFGRQLISPLASPIASITQPAAAAPSDTSASPQPQADPKEIMAYLVSQTRHFKGDANAPVTIIEFSDFQ